MAENFNQQILDHPLYHLAQKLGAYRLRSLPKSQKAVDIELNRIAHAVKKHALSDEEMKKLSDEERAVYEQVLAREESAPKSARADAPKDKTTLKTFEELAERRERPITEDPYYQMAKLLGMDVEKYQVTAEKDIETVQKDLAYDLHIKVCNSSAEQCNQDLQILKSVEDSKTSKLFIGKYKRLVLDEKFKGHYANIKDIEAVLQKVEKLPEGGDGFELLADPLYIQAVKLGISLPEYKLNSFNERADCLRDVEMRIKEAGHEPVEHYPTKEEEEEFRRQQALERLSNAPSYKIAQAIGIDLSGYAPTDSTQVHDILEELTEKVKTQIPEYIKNNDFEKNHAFVTGLSAIIAQAQEDGRINKHNEETFKEILDITVNAIQEKLKTIEATEERTEDMSNEWMDKLTENPIYKTALEAGLIAPGSITINSEEQMINQLNTLADLLHQEGYTSDKEHAKHKEEIDAIRPSMEVAGDEPLKEAEEVKEIVPEEPKKVETEERHSVVVETVGEETPLPAPVKTEDEEKEEEKSWMDIKREVWQEFAASVEHTLTEEDKDNKEKETLEFILSKEEEPKGKVLYSSATNVQITADSELVMYQGLVHDAIKGEMSITFGETLSEKQKLMLYAAALMSEEKYKNGEKIQLIGAPEIDLNNEVFKSLPKEVRDVLSAEVERQAQEAEKLAEIEAAKAKAAEIEATKEPVIEILPEPTAEAEPVPEPAAEPVPEPAAEVVTDEPAAEPVPEPVAEVVAEEPAAEPVPEPAAEVVTEESVAEPVPEPAAEVVAEEPARRACSRAYSQRS